MLQAYSEEKGAPVIKLEKKFTIHGINYSIIGATFHYPLKHTERRTFHSILEVYDVSGERDVVCHQELYEPMLDEDQLTEGINNIANNTTKWLKEV